MKRFIYFSTFVLLILSSVLGSASAQDEMTEVTLFLPYIPSVQFAPVYAAIENGYFADEGIDVTPEYNFDESLGIDRIAVNDLQFGIISGEQVIVARGAEKPLVYIFEWFHNFPVGVVSPADSGITEPTDLVGKTLGIPAASGASYMGYRALLGAAEIDEDDIQLEVIGFTAPENVCTGTVDAAVVYVTNEPLTIEQNCFDVNVIRISDYVDLVSNGLVTNEETIENNPELVAGMVRALQRGVQFVIDNPDEAFTLSVENHVLDLPEAEYETQRQVLANSIELWESDNLGATDPARWETTQQVMLDSGLLEEPLDDLEVCYTNAFLPQGDE